MRTVTESFKVYKYDTAPDEVKEKIREYIVNNWELYEHCMDERIATLKGLAKELSCVLDYSLSCVPSRGEFIKLIPKHDDIDLNIELQALSKNEKSCPFTGVCYDDDILIDIKEGGYTIDGVKNALKNYIESIHSEYDSMTKDEYIKDMCEANDYEFKENGELY